MARTSTNRVIVTPAEKIEEAMETVSDNQTETSSVEYKLDKALELLVRITDKLDRQFEGRISSRAVETAKTEIKETKKETVWEGYVPSDYREIVDTMLNRSFGVQVIPLSDTPSFQLLIEVPKRYSALSDEMKKMYKKDIRAKVISNGEGTVGVRAYVEKVWSSFNPTMQALIVNDRTP